MSASQPPVTEFAYLNLVPPTTLQTSKLISGFLAAVQAQSAWSGYPLYLFAHHSSIQPSEAEPNESESNTTTIYLISGWASVQAHNAWISSSANQELLRFFGEAGMMSVGGLAHLDIDFTKLSFEECSAIAWRKRKGGHDWEGPPAFVSKEASVALPGGIVADRDAQGVEGDTKARVLWPYRGRAVDDGVEDEYELIGLSDGELREFGEGYTVIRKWNLEAGH